MAVGTKTLHGIKRVPQWNHIGSTAVCSNIQYSRQSPNNDATLFKKNLNASKPSEHPPQVEECLKV